MRSVLVVGGAGYVGAHTCKALAETGLRPVTFDNLSTGHRGFVRWGPLIEGDIRDDAAVAAALRETQAIAVLHFAAHACVRESIVSPAEYYDNNVAGSLSLLRAMVAVGCQALVFSSTCAVYGQPAEVPITERTKPDPLSPYGASKLMVERMLEDFHTAYGLRSVRLRYFNACGADPGGLLGELREPETHIIPRALMAIQGHVSDFQVFGADFDTPDGTAVRDYVHVSDLAAGHVAALEMLAAGHAGGVFNLGTGKGQSVKEVLSMIEDVTGRPLPTAHGPRRAGEPARLVADVALARSELGFRPAHSDLSTIVSTAWGWHRRAHPQGLPARLPT